MNEREKKIYQLGLSAQALLQLHLEKPNEFTNERIVDRLFAKFEQLELESGESE